MESSQLFAGFQNNSPYGLGSSTSPLPGNLTGLADPLQQSMSPLNRASSLSPVNLSSGSGIFTVGTSGEVSIDFLFDGGAYEGELAIFSLSGMDRWLQSAPEFFAREAALRALSNSDLGHVVISDRTEEARFRGSLPYDGDFNSGSYLGAKAFSMRPGEQFGVMLVPNGTVEDVLLHGGELEGDQLALFSIALVNPKQGAQFTKLVETHADALNLVDGNTFSFEDLRLDGHSDHDYNDMIFQVRGAAGDATLIDRNIDPQNDWRNSGVGKTLMSYANVDGKGLTARYYDNDDFTGYRGRRTDASVDFNWGNGAPAVMTSPDTFSIQWTGQVESQYSEDYTFYTRSDEKVRLWINGQLLIDHWTNHTLTEDSGKITLQAGQKYDIKLEYAEEVGDASMQLLWSSASQLKEIIPQNALYSDPTALPLDPETGLEYSPNEILVKFNPDVTGEQIETIAQTYGAEVDRLVPFQSGLPSPLDQWRILNFAPDANLLEVRSTFRGDIRIEAVGFDYILGDDSTTPTDPYFTNGDLWGLNKISAPDAWKIQSGSKDVVVAVIDTGVDYTHPDLKNNMWQNPGEILNGFDDDGNGRIDDIHGYDFGDNDSEPIDRKGHGTHVAGTIGAAADGQGVIGVNQNISIMALKRKGDDEGNGTLKNVVRAVDYAVSEGARVINASWNFSRNFWIDTGREVAEFLGLESSVASATDAVKRANDAQVLFVASAGNDGEDTDKIQRFPSTIDVPNVITVAATNQSDQLTDFSNYGMKTVDIAAPGSGIWSTVPGGGYDQKNGTSMAAPHVAGAAALLLAQNPFLTAEQLKNILMTTVDPIDSLKDKTVSGGRLNLKAALDSIQPQRQAGLTIHRIKQVDNLDTDITPPWPLPDIIDRADFYAKVKMGEKDWESTAVVDGKDDWSPNWRFFSNNLTDSTIDITVQLWDSDGGLNFGGDHVDINPRANIQDLHLTYNLLTDEVIDRDTGNAYVADSSGQIHLRGAFDDDKGEIWFSITDSIV
jgi:subtilisin family serine protease